MLERHSEASDLVAAPNDQVFLALDDHSRLSGHMGKSSWRMGGGQMTVTVDEGGGQRVGSHIQLMGRVFGIRLFVDEVVTVHEPPRRKVWRTVDAPHLLVIGPYEMGFELSPEGSASRLRVYIDYDLPATGLPRLLGLMFGPWYARWCTQRMVQDAVIAHSPAASHTSEPPAAV
jgi:hypothetical protein